MNQSQQRRIVVTGLGVISSIGIGKDIFWQSLLQGKSGISKVTSFDTSEHFTHNGGEIKNFDPEKFIDRRKVRFLNRNSQLAISAAKLAVSDSGLGFEDLSQSRTGVCIGTTLGEIQKLEEMDMLWVKSGLSSIKNLQVYQFPTTNIPANVSIELKLNGPSRIFTTACASGNYGIGHGYDMIKMGKADKAIVGGADAFSYVAFTGFNQFSVVAPEKVQPFDNNRKGMMVGEGAGMLVLETLEDARARNARIYAEILGYGLSCDAFHMTNPQVEGVAKCMENALRGSNITADEVDYISPHGTGTRHNDRTEVAAIKKIFGDRAKQIPISSIKSMIGHAMGAASAIEAVNCCLVIENQMVPPTINYETPDPECDIDCVPNKARAHKVTTAINNGFAFGGNNACVVFRKLV